MQKQIAEDRSDAVPATEAIARRAYELFLEAGARHGHDLDHWLSAEHELRKSREL